MGAEEFHTLVLDGIPCFGASNINGAYRFVTLIDVSSSPKINMKVDPIDKIDLTGFFSFLVGYLFVYFVCWLLGHV